MDGLQFRQLVRSLRAAQKRYFRDRRPQDLETSKSLERQVDRELENEGQGELFGGKPKEAR